MITEPLRLVLVEDSADDADLIGRSLARGGYTQKLSLVDSEDTLRAAMAGGEYDLVVTDHELPGFNSSDVLAILRQVAPELPCLLVSGKVGEEAVGRAMRDGAVDYVAKDNLALLPAAVARALAAQELKRQRQATEAALASSGRMFEAVFANARDGMLIVNHDRALLDANPAAAQLLAVSRERMTTLRLDDLVSDAARVEEIWDTLLVSGHDRGELHLVQQDGSLVATEYTAAANFLPDRHILVIRDIRERQAAEAEARRHVSQQEAIVALGEHALREKALGPLWQAAVTCVTTALEVEIAAVLELQSDAGTFAVQAETGLGQIRAGVRIPHSPSGRSQASYTVLHETPVNVEDYATERRFERAPLLTDWGVRSALSVHIPGDQEPFGVLGAASTRPGAFTEADASFLAAVANILTDAQQRAGSEEATQERALHDELTGLANRTLFFDRLGHGLARAKRLGTRLAVVFLDIDRFKALNDTVGHLAADRLLTQLGTRIERTMRETDTVARFGGDEFVVLCEDLADEDEAEILARRLAAALASPFSLDDESHVLAASIGIAMSDAEHLDGEALMRDADAALYRSKANGRGTWTLATATMRDAVVQRSETKRALQHAISSGRLRLHYQPIVSLFDGKICAVEALVRWEDPERGLIPPDDFIPLAEETGLILELGEWVLRAACRQAAEWRAMFGDNAPLPIHVNVSARQVAQSDLPRLVGETLAEMGVPPTDIALEITETSLIDSPDGPIATLVELKRMGLTVVLDDFGTGYSSLSYLERFPIDTLKVDRAFVTPLQSATEEAPIVTAIIGMARAMALSTIAEGVETADQGAAVVALGCSRGQGYFFARPTPAEGITDLVHDSTPLSQRAALINAQTRSPNATQLRPNGGVALA
jgi:diguanylate cyclase (GGDEF)-like protein/PAS domain S-box-containing protein